MLPRIRLVRNLFKQLKGEVTPAQLDVGVYFGALKPLGVALGGVSFSTRTSLLAGGEVDSIKKLGADKGTPITRDSQKAVVALKKGAERKKDEVRNALDLFRKKDPKLDEKE